MRAMWPFAAAGAAPTGADGSSGAVHLPEHLADDVDVGGECLAGRIVGVATFHVGAFTLAIRASRREGTIARALAARGVSESVALAALRRRSVAFDEDVDGDSIPVAGAFAVTVGGTEVTLSGVVAGDGANELRIETSGTVVRDQTVRVSYSRPASGNVVQDPNGNAAESFADYPVDSTQAPQNAPPAPLTAAFGELPPWHTGESFTVMLDFSEEFAVTADRIRAGLTVTGGSVTGVTPAVEGETRSWNIVVTPSTAADAVTLALAPQASCDEEGAICTADGRPVSVAVEVEVPGREPTRVVSARLTTDPGANGTWETGETIEAEVAFNREVAVYGPPDITPTLGITLDGTRREATLTSTGSTATFTFSHTVTTTDDGAVAAAIVASGITLNGTIIADNEGNEADLAFSPRPALAVADVSVTEGTAATADFVVTLEPATSVTVTVDYATADGTATAGSDYTAASGTLTFDAGETTKTVSVPVLDDSAEDSGETFTLTLRNASGAVLLRAVATGTILNTEPRPRVTATFRDVPEKHGGNAFTVELRFSEQFPVSFLTLAPTVGAASSGTDRLWGLGDARSLAPDGGFEAARRLEAEVGYGLGVGGALGVVTPYAGVSFEGGGGSAVRTGARWQIAQGAALSLEAVRREAANDDAAPEHGVMLRGSLHW